MTNETILGQDVSSIDHNTTDIQTSDTFYDKLVGDHGKYKTAEDLARSRIEADEHIRRLEAENKSLLSERSKMDEILQRLDAKPSSTTDTTPPPATDAGNKESHGTLDIKTALRQELAALEAEKKMEANQATALTKLTEAYGDLNTALKAVKTIITTNPAMKNVIDTLGQTDPDALVKIVTAKVEPTTSGTTTTVTTPGTTTSHKFEGNFVKWSEAKEVMNKDPKRYNSKPFRELLRASQAHFESKGLNYFKQT